MSTSEFARGNSFFRNGEYTEAIACYQKAIDACPGFYHYQMNLADACKQIEQDSKSTNVEATESCINFINPGYSRRKAEKAFKAIRAKLLLHGLTSHSFEKLRGIAQNSSNPYERTLAARELALWHMRTKTDEDSRIALEWIARSRRDAQATNIHSKLWLLELLCYYNLKDFDSGLAAYERAVLEHESPPDLDLARANFEIEPQGRAKWINQCLMHYNIEPVKLIPDEVQPSYDRLTCAVDLPMIMGGPKVSVLMAAYEAAETLPTALKSLQEQTWKNLEIIVLDDCSPTLNTMRVAERFAARDSRIKVVRVAENGGAYVARNHGLDMATGDYITLHDADDWSHPRKIEKQVHFMIEHPEVMGCTSEQARCSEELFFTFVRTNFRFIIFNTSSFMWRRLEIVEKLGYWDTVRFGADSEFIGRVKAVYGDSAVVRLETGPLSFQRQSGRAETEDPITGLDSLAYGIRREYKEAQTFHHKNCTSLKYNNDKEKRPFSVPTLMNDPAARDRCINYDIAIWIQLPMTPAEAKANRKKIKTFIRQGKMVVLASYVDSEFDEPSVPTIPDALRKLINDGHVDLLVHGQRAQCRKVINQPSEKNKRMSRLLLAEIDATGHLEKS
jgi:glycosyltransferase involved in cell wall biosynthesis